MEALGEGVFSSQSTEEMTAKKVDSRNARQREEEEREECVCMCVCVYSCVLGRRENSEAIKKK